MVHVPEGQKGVQRRVDRGGAGIDAEGAERVAVHHLVLLLHAAVLPLQRVQAVHVERGEPVALDGPQVAAAALDPEHLHRLAGHRIVHRELGGGVAAAEVGQPQIAAQQVGAVAQQLRFVHSFGFRRDPEVFEVFQISHGFSEGDLRVENSKRVWE